MQKIARRMTMGLLALVVAASMVAVPVAVTPAYADGKPYMKTLKLKWDLKNSRSCAITEKYAGVGKQKHAVKITNLKVKKSSVPGYRQASFTFIDTRKWNPSRSQVHKIANSEFADVEGYVGDSSYFAVVDYYTGKSLEGDNDCGVVVQWSDFEDKGYAKYYDRHNCWVRLPKRTVCRVVITFPQNYKGLCIGLGGNNTLYDSGADDEFWEGNVPFGKTTFYKKGKTNSHWMRIK